MVAVLIPLDFEICGNDVHALDPSAGLALVFRSGFQSFVMEHGSGGGGDGREQLQWLVLECGEGK